MQTLESGNLSWVADLAASHLAAALLLTDEWSPADRDRLSVQELHDLVAAVIVDRVGIARVLMLDAEMSVTAARMREGGMDSRERAELTDAYRVMTGGSRRFDAARSMGQRLHLARMRERHPNYLRFGTSRANTLNP